MGAWGVAALAQVHAALGEKDEAFRWLDAAFEDHVNVLPWIKPPMARPLIPLRDDPRFQDLLDSMHVPR